MGVLAKDKRQMNYIYSSASDLGTKVLGYVESLELDIMATDISRENLGDTILVEVADMLDVEFSELLSPEHPDVTDKFRDVRFSTDDWLKVIDKNPELLQNPIAINGEKAKIIRSRGDILEFYGVDSAGLEQSPQSGPPDTKSNTEGEKFVPTKNE